MEFKFLNFFLDKKDLLSQDSEMLASVLLENNKEQLQSFYEFYEGNSSILYINGFLGTGKVQLTNYSLNFLTKDVVILKYNCFETTILDDIFLVFFEEFKKLQAQKIISEPKVKTENFSQKINSYFSSINKPFLIILDSFESLKKENKKEIIDFIIHLSTFKKIKTVIIGRTFKSDLFPENFHLERITTNALDKNLFEKYLKQNKIKYSNAIFDEFYKNTRGYFFYTTLSIKIMQTKKITLETFIDNFKKSFMTFYEYLEKESLDLIPAISVRFFWLLCLLRHGVSVSLLKQINFYDEENINILQENNILTIDNSQVYIQDYFKEQINVSIPSNVELKLHKFIIEFYEAQLPLKPLERTVLLSRQTMRNEIEYHGLFLPKKQNIQSEKDNLSFISYTKEKDFNLKVDSLVEESSKEQKKEPAKENWISSKNSERTDFSSEDYRGLDLSSIKNLEEELKDLPFKLTPQEMAMLTSQAGNDPKILPDLPLNTKPEENFDDDEKIEITLNDILNYAKECEIKYNYKKMIDLYLKALNYKDDDDYVENLALIYTKLGFAYQKMSDWENAIKYYEQARDFYLNSNEKTKENYINLSIANIYYDSYKPEKAKELLLNISKSGETSEILLIKTYLTLSNIEDSLSNIEQARKYCEKALEHSNSSTDISVLAELYFKYALISDDSNATNSALEYYEKCITLSSDYKVNKFLAAAYSNLATIHLEKRDVGYAVKYFLKAYEIDEINENFDGMYFSATKLATALQKKYPDKALIYYKKAKHCAKKLNDIFYMASASLAVGDFYYNQKQDEFALKEFLLAHNIAKNEFSKENLNKIEMRINDIKFRIGTQKFNQLEMKYKNEQ